MARPLRLLRYVLASIIVLALVPTGSLVGEAGAQSRLLSFQGCLTSKSELAGCTKIPHAGPNGDLTPLWWLSSVAVSPDGRNVYTASYFGDAVAHFGRDPRTGALRYESCIASDPETRGCEIPGSNPFGLNKSLSFPTSLAISSDGWSVYVTSSGSNTIARLSRDPSTGSLGFGGCITSNSNVVGCAQIPGSTPGGAGTRLGLPRSAALSPDGRSLYAAATPGIVRFDRDLDGALSYAGCITSDSEVAGCTQIPGSAPGSFTPLDGLASVTVSRDGRSLYAASDWSDAIARFDRAPQSGALSYRGCITSNTLVAGCTRIPGSNQGGTNSGLDSVNSLAVDPGGRSLYAASSSGIARFARNPRTGALSYKGCLTSHAGVTGCSSIRGRIPARSGAVIGLSSLAVSPDRRSVYTTSHGAALARFERKPRTGALRFARCISSDRSKQTGCTRIPGSSEQGQNTGLWGLTAVAVSPGSGSVYTAAELGDAVAHFNACPRVGLRVSSFTPSRPFGKGPKALGVRAQLRAGRKARVRVSAVLRYRHRGRARTVRLADRRLAVRPVRRFRLALPRPLRSRLRANQRVVLLLRVRARPLRPAGCSRQPLKRLRLPTRLKYVAAG